MILLLVWSAHHDSPSAPQPPSALPAPSPKPQIWRELAASSHRRNASCRKTRHSARGVFYGRRCSAAHVRRPGTFFRCGSGETGVRMRSGSRAAVRASEDASVAPLRRRLLAKRIFRQNVVGDQGFPGIMMHLDRGAGARRGWRPYPILCGRVPRADFPGNTN